MSEKSSVLILNFDRDKDLRIENIAAGGMERDSSGALAVLL